MNKLITTLSLVVFASNSYAGVAALTTHSRANCGNNESISWHLGKNHVLRTISIHVIPNVKGHDADTGWAKTWRSAAVHWGEGTGTPKWTVQGWHYINRNDSAAFAVETVTDCSIYNGWWD